MLLAFDSPSALAYLNNATDEALDALDVGVIRFDAATLGTVLDETIDYILTLRMRPTKVKLRLLAAPSVPMRYVLVQR